MRDTDGSPKITVQSIDRAIAILNSFLHEETQTLSQIAATAGLSRSTAHRLLSSLQAHRLIEQRLSGGTYALGDHVLRLAQAASQAASVLDRASLLLEGLRDETGETSALHVRVGISHRVPIIQAESKLELRRSYTEIGQAIPIHLGAPGKLLLAYLPEQAQERILAHPLAPATKHTITAADELREELVKIRQQEFALSLQERNPGVTTLAVPVDDGTAPINAAVSLTGPAVRLPEDKLREFVPLAAQAAQEIAKLGPLGHYGRDAPKVKKKRTEAADGA